MLIDDLLLAREIEIVVGGRAPADAARIEDLVRVAAVCPIDVDPQRGLEQIEPLEKERALLWKEGFEGREIEHPLVGLHLAEVRIDRAHQREVAGDVVAKIEPGAEAAPPL